MKIKTQDQNRVREKKAKLEITAGQLASLDLLIAKKRSSYYCLDDVTANFLGQVVVTGFVTGEINNVFNVTEIDGGRWTTDAADALGAVAANATVGAVAAGAVGATPAAAILAGVGAVA